MEEVAETMKLSVMLKKEMKRETEINIWGNTDHKNIKVTLYFIRKM